MTTVIKMESTSDANGLGDLSGSVFSFPDSCDMLMGELDFGSSQLYPSTPEAFSRPRHHSLSCSALDTPRTGELNEIETNTYASAAGDDLLEPLDLSLTDLFSIQDEDLHGLISDSYGQHDTNSLFPFDTFSAGQNQDLSSGQKSFGGTRGASPVPRSCDEQNDYSEDALTATSKNAYTSFYTTSLSEKLPQEAHTSKFAMSPSIKMVGQNGSNHIAGMEDVQNLVDGTVFPMGNSVNPYSLMPFVPLMKSQHLHSSSNHTHHADEHGSIPTYPTPNSHTFFIDADCTIPWTGAEMNSYHIPVPDSSFQRFTNHKSLPSHRRAKQCIVDNCTRRAQSNNRCKTHGGGARCQVEGCDKSSQGGGLCRAHGGGKKCGVAGCTKGTQRLGLCYLHGGIRRCMSAGCKKKDRGNGFCISHGGGRRCQVSGCIRSVRKGNYCQAHYSLEERVA